MITPRRLITAALVLAALVPGAAAAQRRSQSPGLFSLPIEAGLRGGRDFENHAWSLGAQIVVPIGQRLELRPSGDFFYPKDAERGEQLNADAALRFGQGGFYAGGGLAFVDLAESAGDRRGRNLFFGLREPPGKRTRSFAEFRWTFYDETSPFRLAVGFTYALTGPWR